MKDHLRKSRERLYKNDYGTLYVCQGHSDYDDHINTEEVLKVRHSEIMPCTNVLHFRESANLWHRDARIARSEVTGTRAGDFTQNTLFVLHALGGVGNCLIMQRSTASTGARTISELRRIPVSSKRPALGVCKFSSPATQTTRRLLSKDYNILWTNTSTFQ